MIISKTPFRISFCGGGTDMPDYYKRGYGAVISSTIDKYVYLAIHKYFEDEFVLKYSQTEVSPNIVGIKHPLIRECLKLTETEEFLEISSFADIPAKGSGLGSSSAFSVGLIKALMAHKGMMCSPEFCAAGACEVEIERLGEPIGKQDQYAAAYGGLNYIRFNADGTVGVVPIILDHSLYKQLNRNLVMFYTGVTRSASTILSEQKSRADTPEYIQYMDAMRNYADALYDELMVGNIDVVGQFMGECWQLKRLWNGVSNPAFDEIYQRAMAAGSIGGKLLGAGGGGFFLFYTPNPEKLITELSDLRHIPFHMESQGSTIIHYQNYL